MIINVCLVTTEQTRAKINDLLVNFNLIYSVHDSISSPNIPILQSVYALENPAQCTLCGAFSLARPLEQKDSSISFRSRSMTSVLSLGVGARGSVMVRNFRAREYTASLHTASGPPLRYFKHHPLLFFPFYHWSQPWLTVFICLGTCLLQCVLAQSW